MHKFRWDTIKATTDLQNSNKEELDRTSIR